jgi:two-component system response regulator PilR (NtrC family)
MNALTPPRLRVLIVDDEADLRELLELTLIRMGLDATLAGTVAEARRETVENRFDLVLTDMRLPDGTGLDVLRLVQAKQPGTPVAVITAFGSAENAVVALKAGAFDYVTKPVALDHLRTLVQSALKAKQEGAPVTETIGRSPLLGESSAMREVRALIARIARSMAPVAITGESGSGKELAARMIHSGSSRASQPFIAVNCGAIPENLMEAEFFGHKKGAFTGAESERDGFFQAANGGTLLLDEVAELPLSMQVKLLRAIQERRVRKVGSATEEPVDVRILSATHRDLAACVAQGAFRQDLFYRLNVIELRVPPLRERVEDMALLAEAMLDRHRAAQGQPFILTADALAALRGHPFPGNVRELENVLERAVALSAGQSITGADLMLPVARAAEPIAAAAPLGADNTLPRSLPDYLDEVERGVICKALAQTGFNRTLAADLLGVSFRQLRYRMQRLGIREPADLVQE